MAIENVLACPLGSKCEEVKDGAIHRCAWYTKLAGENPNTGEIVDEHGCAMAWLPVLLVENARTMRGTSAAVESFRNEMVDANQKTVQTFAALANFNRRPPTLIE